MATLKDSLPGISLRNYGDGVGSETGEGRKYIKGTSKHWCHQGSALLDQEGLCRKEYLSANTHISLFAVTPSGIIPWHVRPILLPYNTLGQRGRSCCHE